MFSLLIHIHIKSQQRYKQKLCYCTIFAGTLATQSPRIHTDTLRLRANANLGSYLSEIHSEPDLWQEVHDNALVLFHWPRLPFVISIIIGVEKVWNRTDPLRLVFKCTNLCCYQYSNFFFSFLTHFFFNLLIQRERERDGWICCSTYAHIHWLLPVCVWPDITPAIGTTFYLTEHPAKAHFYFPQTNVLRKKKAEFSQVTYQHHLFHWTWKN